MAAYGTIIPYIGEATITNGYYLGRKVDITHLAVGDGGGSYYQPTQDQTALKREVWRGRVNVVEKEEGSNVVWVSAYIPADVGGFTIREASAVDADGNHIAIMNTPDTQKVTATEGAQSDLYVSIPIVVSYVDVIKLVTDPTVIMATRKDIAAHANNPLAHHAGQIGYSNPDLPGIKTVQQALDSQNENLSNIVEFKHFAPEMHRMIFRGKNLGTSVTGAQQAAIRNGTFQDLFVGDYWVIDGVNWRIADINYFLNCGDTSFTSPHLVIVPDTVLYNAVMNTSNITTGAYVGSQMYTTNLAQAKTQISNAFGSMVLTHREYLPNAVTNGYPSGGAWLDSTVELMNENMVYGSKMLAPMGNGTIVPAQYTVAKQQLALFALVPKFVNIRANYWLRDVVSASSFALVDYAGRANAHDASNSNGVRPEFCIG